jgi:hypothetical protein
MRNPSARVMKDTINIYYAISGTTADGGYAPSYHAQPNVTMQVATVQYKKTEKIVDELNRITEYRVYAILCPNDPAVNPEDMILYVDNSGITHTLYVLASNDQAGRGSCWRIQAAERR